MVYSSWFIVHGSVFQIQHSTFSIHPYGYQDVFRNSDHLLNSLDNHLLMEGIDH